jgi:hypothetical protein
MIVLSIITLKKRAIGPAHILLVDAHGRSPGALARSCRLAAVRKVVLPDDSERREPSPDTALGLRTCPPRLGIARLTPTPANPDVIARLMGPALSERLGQPVVIEN